MALQPFAIVGTGASTAVGCTAPASIAAARAGIAGFSEHPFAFDRTGEPIVVARAPNLDENVAGVDRFLALALPAAREAMAGAGDDWSTGPTLSLVLALPASRPGLPENLATQLCGRLQAGMQTTCRVVGVESVSNGHAAGLMALQLGQQAIEERVSDFCLVGGVDSYLDPQTLAWLEDCDQIHSAGPENNAWGYIPGEAAGFCVLASAAAIDQYNLRVKSRVLAVATTHEQNLIKSEAVCLGEGLTQAFRQVFPALPAEVRVDQVICDMNGEPYRADEFGFAMIRTSARFADPADFLAPADCWGDIGSASGPLLLTMATIAGQKGYSKGPHWLAWTSSETGERACALLNVASG